MTPEEIDICVRTAMRKAFLSGEKHWQYADSDYTSHWKKADGVRADFNNYVDEVTAVLSALGDRK